MLLNLNVSRQLFGFKVLNLNNCRNKLNIKIDKNKVKKLKPIKFLKKKTKNIVDIR